MSNKLRVPSIDGGRVITSILSLRKLLNIQDDFHSLLSLYFSVIFPLKSIFESL